MSETPVEAPVKKKPGRPRKVAGESVLQEVETAVKQDVAEVETVVEHTAEVAKADVIEEVAKAKTEVDIYEAKLEGLAIPALMKLHDEAIIAEDAAKRELHVLRVRAVNMATTAEADAEKEIIVAKGKVAEAEAWLRAIEKKLWGYPRDIYGERYGRTDKK